MGIGAASRRVIRVVFAGFSVMVALASVGIAALEIEVTPARPDTAAAVAFVGVSAPRAADLVVARKSAGRPTNVTQQAAPVQVPAAGGAPIVAAAPKSTLQQQYEPVARAAAAKYGVDPDVFVRQITQESHWDPASISPSGAQGIAQFMPTTAAGRGVDPLDPIAALDAAAKLDHENLVAFDGDYAKMLAAYNAGQGSVIRYGGVPPFPETQMYVAVILGAAGPSN